MKTSIMLTINRLLSIEYNKRHAPIVELVKAQTDDPFKILVATILSARTKDETTAFAVSKLFKVVKKLADLRTVPVKQLEKLIFPVGFYHTKAKHLKLLPDAVDQKFGGKLPQTVEELCELPGVGRKTANLVVAIAFNKPAVCVDVHVHRICNRLGLLKTKTPFDTEMTLRKILPKKIWKTWNSRLVSYGQTVCSPISPKCSICVITPYCKRIGVISSK
ncbi:MAG: endonuclease III [Kiritimatiellae bacterium]|nr:endonuclease III [Kiritimatiellia bacterium]MDD5523398.1 endonuclease III [Kiritimatiellia bacterium]